MYMTTVRLASPGPPWVMMNGESKIWKPLIMLMTRAKNVVLESIGSVTWRKLAQRPAPSIAAASYRWRGIFCRPATNRMKLNPTDFQTCIRTIDQIAHALEVSQG